MLQHTPDQPLAVQDRSDGLVIFLTGAFRSITDANAPLLGDLLGCLAVRAGTGRLILDFRDVEFLSSAALGTFVALHWLVRGQGGYLELRELDDKVFEIFEVTRLVHLLNARRAAGTELPRLAGR